MCNLGAMAHETRVPSSLPIPPCGVALYRSNSEDPGQRVEVTFHEGVHVAIVADGEDAGEVLPIATMHGIFQAVP